MSITLRSPDESFALPEVFASLVGTDDYNITQFYDDCVYDKGKGYHTFKITTKDRAFVLKQYAEQEDLEAECRQYAFLEGLPVPRLLGRAEKCVLMEFVEGDDLKSASEAGLRALAKSLAAIMNAYPMGRGYAGERYERYLKRLDRRALCLADEPLFQKAFALFYERQREIPLTLSNGDLLPINVLFDGERACIIDWEFGGFLPYALDLARFIAHFRPQGEVSSFRLPDEGKALFLDLMYDALTVKPAREVFDRDLRLAVFNEYVEILEYYLNDKSVERGAVFADYYPRALALAESLRDEEGQAV